MNVEDEGVTSPPLPQTPLDLCNRDTVRKRPLPKKGVIDGAEILNLQAPVIDYERERRVTEYSETVADDFVTGCVYFRTTQTRELEIFRCFHAQWGCPPTRHC